MLPRATISRHAFVAYYESHVIIHDRTDKMLLFSIFQNSILTKVIYKVRLPSLILVFSSVTLI